MVLDPSTVLKKKRSLENKRVYAVTKLIKEFTPRGYMDPLKWYSNQDLKDNIEKYVQTSCNPLSTVKPKLGELSGILIHIIYFTNTH